MCAMNNRGVRILMGAGPKKKRRSSKAESKRIAKIGSQAENPTRVRAMPPPTPKDDS